MDKVYVLSFCDTWSEVYGVFTSFEEAKESMIEIMEENDETVDRVTYPYHPHNVNVCYWVSDEYYYSIDEFELNILK